MVARLWRAEVRSELTPDSESLAGVEGMWTVLQWPMMRVEASMWMVVVGDGGGVKSGLGTEGWMLAGVVDEARKARRRRRLFISCGGVGGVLVVWVDLSAEGLEAAIEAVLRFGGSRELGGRLCTVVKYECSLNGNNCNFGYRR